MKPLVVLTATLAAGVLLALHPSPAFPTWWENGVPVAESDRIEDQPILARDDAGGAFIAWQSFEGGTPYYYVTRITASGDLAPGWTAEGVEISGPAYFGEVVPDGAGGALFAWVNNTGYGSLGSIGATRLTSTGAFTPGWPSPGTLLVPRTPPRTRANGREDPESPRAFGALFPSLIRDGAGGVIIAWMYMERFSNYLHVTRYTGDGGAGAGDPFASTYGWAPRICADGDSGAFIHSSTVLRHLLGSGELDALWPAAGLSMTSDAQAWSGEVCPDGQGGVFVAWLEHRGGTGQQCVLQRVTASGARAPGWPEGGIVLSPHSCQAGGYRIGPEYIDQHYTSIVPDGTGGALVAWQDARADTGDIYLQRILADGSIAPGWPEHGAAACVAVGLQRYPVLTGDGRGGAIVAWQDERLVSESDIYAQLIRSDGTLVPDALPGGTGVCTAYGQQQLPRIVEDDAGGALITWVDRRRDADIYAAHFFVDGVVATLTSLAVAEVREGAVHLEWTTSRPSGSTAELSRRDGPGGWSVLATLEADASRRFVWRDRAVTPGQRYRYRLGERMDGVVEYTPEVEVLVPSALAFAIEPVTPNPASGNVTIGFTVPEAGNARLEIIDLQGRMRDRQNLGALEPGRHTVGVALRGRLPAGIYWAQLAWREETKQVRFAVVQ